MGVDVGVNVGLGHKEEHKRVLEGDKELAAAQLVEAVGTYRAEIVTGVEEQVEAAIMEVVEARMPVEVEVAHHI